MDIKNKINIRYEYGLNTEAGWHRTGAMYSSVPTNEFECVLGSATKTGGT